MIPKALSPKSTRILLTPLKIALCNHPPAYASRCLQSRAKGGEHARKVPGTATVWGPCVSLFVVCLFVICLNVFCSVWMWGYLFGFVSFIIWSTFLVLLGLFHIISCRLCFIFIRCRSPYLILPGFLVSLDLVYFYSLSLVLYLSLTSFVQSPSFLLIFSFHLVSFNFFLIICFSRIICSCVFYLITSFVLTYFLLFHSHVVMYNPFYLLTLILNPVTQGSLHWQMWKP